MRNITTFIKKYPLSLLCTIAIWGLSLTPFFPETPLDNVEFADKWTHLVMYGGTCIVIWWEYLRSHSRPNATKLFWIAVVGMIVEGGVLELLQAYCTTTRSGEWLDFLADSIGVLLGTAAGIILLSVRRRNHRQEPPSPSAHRRA